MIHGIGIDIVDVSRIKKIMERWGNRFLGRVFTQNEIRYCRDKVPQATRFALRFAAKEAFAKALGLGLRDGITFQQIEVIRSSLGQPHLNLHGRSKDLCARCGIRKSFLSLSDDGPYAVAIVILEL